MSYVTDTKMEAEASIFVSHNALLLEQRQEITRCQLQ